MADEEPGDYVERCVRALADAPPAWFARNWLHARGLTNRTVEDYLLGYDQDRNAIVIPYLNALGEVRGYRWRNLSQGSVKYMQPKGEGLHLFHVKASRKPRVWLCEGEFDSMILDQLGFPSVGVPGVNAFKDEWAYLFAYCDQVNIVFDSDEAGKEGAARVGRVISNFVTKVQKVGLPHGKDVTDLYLADRQGLVDLIK